MRSNLLRGKSTMKKLNLSAQGSLARQKGIGTITLMSFILMLGVTGYIGVKLAPSYVDYRMIAHAMDEAVKTQSIETYRSKQIINVVKRTLTQTSNGPDIDLDKVTSVFMRDGLKVVKVNYEVVVPVIKNASALLHFTHEATIDPYANTAAHNKNVDLKDDRLIAAR